MAIPHHQREAPARQASGAPEPLPPGTERYVLNELAAGIAHELNQPLAAIAAYADGAATLLRRDPAHPPQALHILQAIAGQALRAGDVIEQLRGAARPLTGPEIPLDPNELVRTVKPLLEALSARQAVRLLVELRTPSPAVLGDADRLQALLVLLFGTALSTVSRLPQDRRRVILSTDEGAGDSVQLSASEPHGILFQLQLPLARI